MNVEKFTFSSIETWKPATSLQTNSFIRDFTGIRSSRLEVFCKKGVLRNFTKLTCHYFTTATHYLKLYWKMNSFKVTFQRLCINGKCILICKSIDWFLRKQPVRGVPWSEQRRYIRRTTIFIFSLCVVLVTQLNGSALGVLKHHYINKRMRELLIGNSRFLIYNSLNKLLYYVI